MMASHQPGPILVTGGAGYIGSALVARLLGRGYQVRVLDNLSCGGEALLPWLGSADFELIVGDIRSKKDIVRSVSDCRAVVHLAAIVGDPACAAQPELARAINGNAPRALYQAAVDSGVDRFIFASTCSNYGQMPDSEGYVDETSPLNPVSLYAELKVACEKFLLNEPQDRMTTGCLRFATAYGLSPRPRFDLTVNEFTRDLTLGQPLEIYGEQFWRPYCHVADLSQACQAALEIDIAQVAGRAFNVGDSAENYRKKDLIELITTELPEAAKLVSYVSRDEDPRDYRVNCDLIASQLGFEITRRVPDGIKEIIHAIRTGVLSNPRDQRYSNAPPTQSGVESE
jgi:nucleoside-diphosphate-sugar epimerase